MPKLLIAFMAVLMVSCASTDKKAPADQSYYFDAMTSNMR